MATPRFRSALVFGFSALASILSIRFGLKWLLDSLGNEVPSKGWRFAAAITINMARQEPGTPVPRWVLQRGCWTHGAQTRLIFFAFKYKQHYLAPHMHRIKICNVFQWWSLENSVQGSPHPPFSLILLDMKGEEEGARPWNVNSFWADFSNCLNFTISLLSKIRKEGLTGCSSWTLLLLLSYFTNYTIKLIDSWGKPRL